MDRPGAAFFGAGGEERDEAEQVVGGLDEPFKAGALQAHLVEKHGALFFIQLGDLSFEIGADDHDARAFPGGNLADDVDVRVTVRHVGFGYVGGVEDGLVGQQKERA